MSQYSSLGLVFLGRMNHCTAGSPPYSPFLKEVWISGRIVEMWSENHHSLAGGAVVQGSDLTWFELSPRLYAKDTERFQPAIGWWRREHGF